MNDVIRNYRTVNSEISSELEGRTEQARKVQLVVVSKFHGVERIRPLLEDGHRTFGESRLEEAQEKWSVLAMEFNDVSLHYIGAMQSKKVKDIVKLFDVIHSIDRPETAMRVAKEIDMQGRNVSCLIQINIGQEPQKSGVLPEDFEKLFRICTEDYNLNISGVMCIPPAGLDPSPYFLRMKGVKDTYGLPELSIGMSSDYLCAVSHGATMVRVGAKILGARN
ncbi:YggS family pyridoxal phosphate-dependent enzyme [Pseudomonas sp. RL_15y_Pfl2_60]|uniref:YggS family pyridoxal phosphate-dependent enzyme n=1 Tax=Pseudomonas sp. RL_15y_Pfl2_60 TaxID=3088709 RepID=UPI0030D929E7